MSQTSAVDPFAYRHEVEKSPPRRAAPYAGPLAWAEGRMYVDGEYGEVIVRVHDAGQLGNVRREMTERLALNWGVYPRRFEEIVLFSRQGGRFCGDERRVARHALKITGDALKVARFAADLPGVLAAIERAATAMMRTLGGWIRDSAHGQRWADVHDARHQRVERRWWRRSYMRHLAEWIGPEAPEVEADMPDWSEDWLSLCARIAQATAHTVDITAVRDHMTEALLYAKAARPEPREVEAEPAPRTRYTTVWEAINAPAERCDEIGDVEFHVGDPAELARAAARRDQLAADELAGAEVIEQHDEHQEQTAEDQVGAVAELPHPAATPRFTARPAGLRLIAARPSVGGRIAVRRPAYGSISTRGRHRPPHHPRAGGTRPPTAAARPTHRRKASTHR
ncbi:hypothetical protein ABZ851_37145 [Streptomyces sp. NPDC047049]|uniref:hypothetical protein n=1 Tax=Streptomyces sp. NPDC047049 TaxID=3156688 RepID=UPI0033ECEC6E